MKSEPAAAEAPAAAAAPRHNLKLPLIAAAAVVVLGVGGFFAWRMMRPPPPPPPVAAKPKAAAPKANVATTPAGAPTSAPSAAANKTAPLSETQSAIAHAPVNAINKAQAALAKRDAAGQSRIEDAGDELANKPATSESAANANVPKASTAVTTVAPGITATTEVTAAAEASAAFKSFVMNAKISGVFQGNPAKAFINNRMVRAGETVDNGLGITFDSIDPDKKMIFFKDKAGASVSRRY